MVLFSASDLPMEAVKYPLRHRIVTIRTDIVKNRVDVREKRGVEFARVGIFSPDNKVLSSYLQYIW